MIDYFWLALVIVLALNLPLAVYIGYRWGYTQGHETGMALDRSTATWLAAVAAHNAAQRASYAAWAYPWPARTDVPKTDVPTKEATDAPA